MKPSYLHYFLKVSSEDLPFSFQNDFISQNQVCLMKTQQHMKSCNNLIYIYNVESQIQTPVTETSCWSLFLMGHVMWRPLLGLLSWYPFFLTVVAEMNWKQKVTLDWDDLISCHSEHIFKYIFLTEKFLFWLTFYFRLFLRVSISQHWLSWWYVFKHWTSH